MSLLIAWCLFGFVVALLLSTALAYVGCFGLMFAELGIGYFDDIEGWEGLANAGITAQAWTFILGIGITLGFVIHYWFN